MYKDNFLKNFFQIEATSGIILFLFTLAALIWTNSPIHESYYSFWHISIGKMSLHQWINDGLMAIFFFVVGVEIKQEFTTGELASKKKAALPIAAAIGGMIIPALIYIMLNYRSSGFSGWGIPMATDIAFVIGVMSLFGNRIPLALKVFLLTLAIVDDLGAVLVIAIFYTAKIHWLSLIIGLFILSVILFFNQLKIIFKTLIYLILGVFVWLAFLKSGVHATVAGVLLAFVMPLNTTIKLRYILHSWVSFAIVPLFALANAGVTISNETTLYQSISMGIIAGLVLGKPIGIFIFSWLAVQFKLAILPDTVNWKQIFAVGCLAGIGFTMSLFIANLAFDDGPSIEATKPAILMGSIIAGVIGAFFLFLSSSAQTKSNSSFHEKL